MDEPTTGLDPRSRLDIWNIVRELVGQGTSILLTTQYLEEADQLADTMAVISHGKVIAEGTSSELKAQLGDGVVEFSLTNIADKQAALQAVARFATKASTYDETTLQIRVPVADSSAGLMNIVGALNNAQLNVAALSIHQPSLDDVFLSLTGETVKEDKVAHSKPKGGHGHGHAH